jgi:hypothetical protein
LRFAPCGVAAFSRRNLEAFLGVTVGFAGMAYLSTIASQSGTESMLELTGA